VEETDRTRWRWAGGTGSSTGSGTGTFLVSADDAADVGDMMRISVLVDTAVLPPDEAVARLRALERLLCAATTAEIETSEIGDLTNDLACLRPAPRSADWCLTEGGWAHLPTVADLLRRAAGGRRADVFAAPGPGGHHLLAYVDGTVPVIDIARLHAACVDALPGLRTAVAPHHYVVCAGAPVAEPAGPADAAGPVGPADAARADLTAWQRLPVLAKGTGRSG
jgi:hypothetical protein